MFFHLVFQIGTLAQEKLSGVLALQGGIFVFELLAVLLALPFHLCVVLLQSP